jgi:hypothetical protein
VRGNQTLRVSTLVHSSACIRSPSRKDECRIHRCIVRPGPNGLQDRADVANPSATGGAALRHGRLPSGGRLHATRRGRVFKREDARSGGGEARKAARPSGCLSMPGRSRIRSRSPAALTRAPGTSSLFPLMSARVALQRAAATCSRSATTTSASTPCAARPRISGICMVSSFVADDNRRLTGRPPPGLRGRTI